MFTSVLLACHIIFPSFCVNVVDTLGPYQTHQACVVRVADMRLKTRAMFKRNRVPFVIIAWRCDEENTV